MKEKELPGAQDTPIRQFTSQEEFRAYFNRENFDSDVEFLNAMLPYIENLDEVMARTTNK